MSSAVRLATSTVGATAVNEVVSPAGAVGPEGTPASLLELDDDELLLESLLACATAGAGGASVMAGAAPLDRGSVRSDRSRSS